MTTITKERIELFVKSPLENGLTRSEQMELARIALAALEAEPEPIVPESISVRQAISALESADCVTTIGQAYKMGWNACRSAMLQSKYRDLSQPVDPQISEYEKIMQWAGWVMVPVEPTDEMIAAAMNCEDVLFNSDESFCVQFGNIYEAMLAAAPQQEVK
ncbi:hypothetical protein EAP59_26130 [Salmonella enterica]|nr:hypothetical protein [Salmonella enterica]